MDNKGLTLKKLFEYEVEAEKAKLKGQKTSRI